MKIWHHLISFYFIIVSCNSSSSEKIVETKNETIDCLIGKWERLDRGPNGEKLVLIFNAELNKNIKEKDEYNYKYYYNPTLSFELIDKDGKLIEKMYEDVGYKFSWEVTDVGHIRSEISKFGGANNSYRPDEEFVLTNCSRMVKSGEIIYIKVQ